AGDAQAERALEEVIERAAAFGSETMELRANIELLAGRLGRNELAASAALDLLEEAIRVLDTAGDEFGLGRAWHLSSVVHGGYLFNIAQAEKAAAQAREHYRRCGFVSAAAVPLIATAMHEGSTPALHGI